jgi:hypothetical protein
MFQTFFWTPDGERIPFEVVQRFQNFQVVPFVEVEDVFVNKAMRSVQLKLRECIVYPPPERPSVRQSVCFPSGRSVGLANRSPGAEPGVLHHGRHPTTAADGMPPTTRGGGGGRSPTTRGGGGGLPPTTRGGGGGLPTPGGGGVVVEPRPPPPAEGIGPQRKRSPTPDEDQQDEPDDA